MTRRQKAMQDDMDRFNATMKKCDRGMWVLLLSMPATPLILLVLDWLRNAP